MKVLKYSSVTIILILKLLKTRYILYSDSKSVEEVVYDCDILCLLLPNITLLDLDKKLHEQYEIEQIVRAACHL